MRVDLVPRLIWGDVELTDRPFALRFGADFGSGANVYQILETELFDGEVVSSSTTENRTMTFEVAIMDEADMAGMELAAARLERQAEKERSLLVFEPGDRVGTPWAIETYRAQMRFKRVDEYEQSMFRVYELEIPASPHVRTVDPVVVPAAASGEEVAAPVAVDGGSSLSGWAGSAAGLSATVTGPAPTVVAPTLRTNRVPNPRFEGFTYWAVGASGSLPGVESNGAVRLARPPVPGAPHLYIPGALRLVSASSFPTVTPGVLFTASLRLSSPVNVVAGGLLRLHWMNGATELSTSQSAAMPANPSGRFSVTGTAPAGATHARIWLELASIPGQYSPASIRVSEPMLEQSATMGDYFDGSTTASSTVAYGWAGAPNLSQSVARAKGTVSLTRSGLSANFASTPYLHVDFASPAQWADSVAASVNGTVLQRVALASLGQDRYRAVFAASGVATTVEVTVGNAQSATPASLTVNALTRSGSAAAWSGTARQLFRSFTVHGTARTPGTLHVAHMGGLGGSVLLYTCADDGSGYQPPTRQFKTAGGTDIVDVDAASGAATPISSVAYRVDVPLAQLPVGKYRFMGRLRRAVAGRATFTLTATTALTGSQTVSWEIGNAYVNEEFTLVDLGSAMLPTTRVMPGGAAVQRISIKADDASVVHLDDLYLLNVTTGAVVVVGDLEYQPGVSRKHLWVDAPTVDHPFPALYVGDSPDRAGAYAPGPAVKVWQPSVWKPGPVNVFSVCEQPNAAVEATYYPRFLHNAHPLPEVS